MKKTGILLAAALGCLLAAGALHGPLLERRATLQPAHQTDLREAPPLVAFTTIALGGFRGILADLLWMRIATLQEAGRYVEIAQLSDWITKLEPTFSDVWGYHAWNMAYNISAWFEAPADRWRWVEQGVRLLREDGLRYNPRDPRLYWELGWIYHHKIGGSTDPASGYYRARLFDAMAAILPDGRGGSPVEAGSLQTRFGLEPARMAELDRTVGPLDWRLPESHALYWAWCGRRQAGSPPDLMLERLFYQSMMTTALQGGFLDETRQGSAVRRIRTDLFPAALAVLDEARRRFPDDPGIAAAAFRFERKAVVLYFARREDDAAHALWERRFGGTGGADALRRFVQEQAEQGMLTESTFLGELHALLVEAGRARQRGEALDAERRETIAAWLYQGMVRRLAEDGMAPPITLDQIRDRALHDAVRRKESTGVMP